MKKIRYFFETSIVRLLFYLLRLVSIDKASNIGGFIARSIGPHLAVTNIAKKNLKLALPELNEQQQQEIIISMWDNLGRVVTEFPHLYNLSKEEFFARVRIEGLENLEYIKKQGGIFFSGHIANWEISPRIPVEHDLKLALIYRSANNKEVDKIICGERSKHNIAIIPKGARAARQIIENLKQGNALAMLVDQKMNDGIKVPFFNKDAMTAPAIARLALNFNCPIIPAQVIRTNGANFIVKIMPPIELNKSNDNEADIYNLMVKINLLIEGWIRENPGQWFWLHKRWVES